MEPAPRDEKTDTLLNVNLPDEAEINRVEYTSINTNNQELHSEAPPIIPLVNSEYNRDLQLCLPSCNHNRVDLDIEISQCETMMCTCCCIFGFVAIIIGIIACVSKSNNGCSGGPGL
jgi:hypothetical protein